jgi:hypothetical protein
VERILNQTEGDEFGLRNIIHHVVRCRMFRQQ